MQVALQISKNFNLTNLKLCRTVNQSRKKIKGMKVGQGKSLQRGWKKSMEERKEGERSRKNKIMKANN